MYNLDHRNKISRAAKRFLSLMATGDAHIDGDIRRTFMRAEAHAQHVRNTRNVKQIIGGDETTDVKTEEVTISE